MAKLIASAVVLVALAVLIVLNVNYKSAVNLFGAQFENVSIIVIAIAGFVLGIIYTVIIYVINLSNKQKKAAQKKKREDLKQKEAELKQREELPAAGAAGGESPPIETGARESIAGRGAAETERLSPFRRTLRKLRGKM